jgi:hydroxypyruvate reductase
MRASSPPSARADVARGSLVDEQALVAALSEGRLGAAGLDVYRPAQEVDPALRSAPNIVFTPYVGSATEQTRRAMADSVWRNVFNYLSGDQPEHAYSEPD